MSRCLGLGALFIAAMILAAGCASDTDPIVFKLKDRQMTLSEVKEAYNQFQYPKLMRYLDPEEVYKTDPWAEADFETRKEYIETLTRKDLIVAFARDFSGDEFTGCDLITYRRWYEKRVTHFFWPTFSRDLGDVPPAMVDSLASIRADQRKMTQIICRNEDDAREVYEKISAGADFATVGREYTTRDSVLFKYLEPSWGDAIMAAPALRDPIFSIREPGTMPPPIQSKMYGWHVIRVDSVRLADVSGELEMITKYATDKWRQAEAQTKFDRIMADLDYRPVPENAPVLQRHLAAMWDSLFADGASPDLALLKAPRHRFTPAERALPICYRYGKPFTIGEFVASLDKVDIDYWPPRGADQFFERRIENRVKRLTMFEQAKQIGAETNADFLREKTEKIEEIYLEIFERDYINKFTAGITADQIRAHWQTDPSRYFSSEVVGYSYLQFPAIEKELAWRIYGELGDASEWGETPQAAKAASNQTRFVSDVAPERGDAHPEITALALQFTLAADDRPIFTEPLPVGEEWVILRIHRRQRPRQLSFDEATGRVRQELQTKAIDDSLAALLGDLEIQFDLNINFDALK